MIEEKEEERKNNLKVTWPKKHGVRTTTITLPDNADKIFRPPAPEDIKLKFYDRSNSSYQKQVYLNGKYLGTTIAPTRDHEEKILEVLYYLMGIGIPFDDLKKIFKSTFTAQD